MIQDPRRYVQMLAFLRVRIEDGTYKPHELMVRHEALLFRMEVEDRHRFAVAAAG